MWIFAQVRHSKLQCEDYPEGPFERASVPVHSRTQRYDIFLAQACSNISMVYRRRFLLPSHVLDLKD